MSDQQHVYVKLGKHELPVTAQTHAGIEFGLAGLLSGARVGGDAARSVDGFIAALGSAKYRFYSIFVPNMPSRMPEWEFNGFGSKEAYEEGQYEPEHDAGPTWPQLLDAFDVIVQINGGNRFMDLLGKFGAATPLKKLVTGLLDSAIDSAVDSKALPSGSPSSPGTNGVSLPTSSGTPGRTSSPPVTEDESESGSPTPISSGSLQPISV